MRHCGRAPRALLPSCSAATKELDETAATGWLFWQSQLQKHEFRDEWLALARAKLQDLAWRWRYTQTALGWVVHTMTHSAFILLLLSVLGWL